MSLFDSLRRMFGSTGNGDSERGEHHQGITCEDALRLVSDFIDGELDGVSRQEVEAHFEVCTRCYPHLRLEQSFRAAVRRACERETAPPELRERVLDMVSEEGS